MSPSDYQKHFGNGPEFVAGSVFGIREFTYTPKADGANVLCGSYGKEWTSVKKEAECFSKDTNILHEGVSVPVEGCTCGIYGFWHKDSLDDGVSITAVVEAYGKVIIGDVGFKAQKARIVAFSVNRETWVPAFEKVLVKFNVPIYSSMDEMLKRHPTTMDYYDPEVAAQVKKKNGNMSSQLTRVSIRLEKAAKELEQLIITIQATTDNLNKVREESKDLLEEILPDEPDDTEPES